LGWFLLCLFVLVVVAIDVVIFVVGFLCWLFQNQYLVVLLLFMSQLILIVLFCFALFGLRERELSHYRHYSYIQYDFIFHQGMYFTLEKNFFFFLKQQKNF